VPNKDAGTADPVVAKSRGPHRRQLPPTVRISSSQSNPVQIVPGERFELSRSVMLLRGLSLRWFMPTGLSTSRNPLVHTENGGSQSGESEPVRGSPPGSRLFRDYSPN
jgi:hypothetical protein